MRCFRVHTGNVTRAGYPLIFYMHIRTTSKEKKPDKGNRWDTTKKRKISKLFSSGYAKDFKACKYSKGDTKKHNKKRAENSRDKTFGK